MTTNFGTVNFEGKELTLTSDAVITGRQLQSSNNYNDVEVGEKFEFEMSSSATDKDNNEVTVYWMFTDIKGEDEKESLDMFDYDVVNRVERA